MKKITLGLFCLFSLLLTACNIVEVPEGMTPEDAKYEIICLLNATGKEDYIDYSFFTEDNKLLVVYKMTSFTSRYVVEDIVDEGYDWESLVLTSAETWNAIYNELNEIGYYGELEFLMCANNNDYLIRIKCNQDGTVYTDYLTDILESKPL